MITVYFVPRCRHCRALLEDLERRHVRHLRVDLEAEPDRLVEILGLTWERRLPVVVDHERCSVGFRGNSCSFEELGLPIQAPGAHPRG